MSAGLQIFDANGGIKFTTLTRLSFFSGQFVTSAREGVRPFPELAANPTKEGWIAGIRLTSPFPAGIYDPEGTFEIIDRQIVWYGVSNATYLCVYGIF